MKIELELIGILEEGVNFAADKEGADPTEYIVARIIELAESYACQMKQQDIEAYAKTVKDGMAVSIETAKADVAAKMEVSAKLSEVPAKESVK